MATMIGKKDAPHPLAENNDYPKKGTVIQHAVDRGPNDSGAPFETSKAVPFTVIEGDPEAGTARVYHVSEEAIAQLQKHNHSQSGFKTKKCLSYEQAVEIAENAPENTMHKTSMASVTSVAEAHNHDTPTVLGHAKEPEAPSTIVGFQQFPVVRKQRINVRFEGRLGRLTAPYDAVFIDGIALVLIQNSDDGMYYEPPQDFDDLMRITWGDTFADCHSGIHYKMPDGKSAHSVYLISEDGVRGSGTDA